MMLEDLSEEFFAIIPPLYSQRYVRDAVVYGHFYVNGHDWFITESDGKGRFFGFGVFGPGYGEWGNTSLGELKRADTEGLLKVRFDECWTPKRVCEISQIIEAGGLKQG